MIILLHGFMGLTAFRGHVVDEHPVVSEISKFIHTVHISGDILIFNMCNRLERAQRVIDGLLERDREVFLDGTNMQKNGWSSYGRYIMMVFTDAEAKSDIHKLAYSIISGNFWNQNIKIIVVHTGENENLDDILKILTYYRIIDLVLLLYVQHDLISCSYNPYSDKIKKFYGYNITQNEIFPVKTRNLMGHRLRIAQMDIYPHEQIIYGRLSGFTGSLLDTIMESLNATYEIVEIKNAPVYTISRLFMTHKADFNFNFQLLFTNYYNMSFTKWTSPISIHKVCCLIPHQSKEKTYEWILIYLSRNSLVTSITYCSFMLIMAFLWSITSSPRMSFYKSLWLLQPTIFLSAIPAKIKTSKERIIVGSVILTSFFYINALLCCLIADLINVKVLQQIDTLEQLSKTEMPILLQPVLKAPIKASRHSYPPGIYEKVKESNISIWDIKNNANRTKIAYAIDVFEIANFLDSAANREPSGVPIFHLMKECLISLPAVFPFPINSPYLDHMNDIMKRTFEGGLWQHWMIMERHKLLKDHLLYFPAIIEDEVGKKVIKFHHIKITLPILVMGWLLSGVVLLLELLHVKYHHLRVYLQRRRRHRGRTGN
ncbi:hypothetical protein DMENIID0001_127130 [Sergentomyia squamirostris]